MSHRPIKMTQIAVIVSILTLAVIPAGGQNPKPTIAPLVKTIDMNIGQAEQVELYDGTKAEIKLNGLTEQRDPIRNAVRKAQVSVTVNGRDITLVSSTYHLPKTIAGVQIDCPVTRGYVSNSSKSNAWGLVKDARIRLWPAGSPLITPGTFVYPIKQKIFASDTQMANAPCFVDGGELPSNKNIYYHYGLDFGGAEKLDQVIAATDGLVVSSGGKTLEGHEKDTPVSPRYDVVYILDNRGWYYRYSHLYKIDDAIKPGAPVKMGQPVGILGKEGGSGGWSHLHFDINSRQPSGLWGNQNGYAFIWEAYLKENDPDIIAVARPHVLAYAGTTVTLDGSKSWSKTGRIDKYEWFLGDGRLINAETVKKTYNKAGEYNEILKVTDSDGNIDYDFAVVQIIDPDNLDKLPPTIHAVYYPSTGIKAGDQITLKVRSFRAKTGSEIWDFGDGTKPVTVQSDGNADMHNPDGYAITRHAYKKPGDYIATVQRTNEYGYAAKTHLHIRVE